MKIVTFILFTFLYFILWLSSTSLVHNGKHDRIAFFIKTVIYFISVALAFALGFYYYKLF